MARAAEVKRGGSGRGTTGGRCCSRSRSRRCGFSVAPLAVITVFVCAGVVSPAPFRRSRSHPASHATCPDSAAHVVLVDACRGRGRGGTAGGGAVREGRLGRSSAAGGLHLRVLLLLLLLQACHQLRAAVHGWERPHSCNRPLAAAASEGVCVHPDAEEARLCQRGPRRCAAPWRRRSQVRRVGVAPLQLREGHLGGAYLLHDAKREGRQGVRGRRHSRRHCAAALRGGRLPCCCCCCCLPSPLLPLGGRRGLFSCPHLPGRGAPHPHGHTHRGGQPQRGGSGQAAAHSPRAHRHMRHGCDAGRDIDWGHAEGRRGWEGPRSAARASPPLLVVAFPLLLLLVPAAAGVGERPPSRETSITRRRFPGIVRVPRGHRQRPPTHAATCAAARTATAAPAAAPLQGPPTLRCAAVQTAGTLLTRQWWARAGKRRGSAGGGGCSGRGAAPDELLRRMRAPQARSRTRCGRGCSQHAFHAGGRSRRGSLLLLLE